MIRDFRETETNIKAHISMMELQVRSSQTALKFYTSVFGWDYEAFYNGGVQNFALIDQKNGQVIAAISPAKDENAFWVPYIEVPCLETAVESCIKNGGSVVEDTRKIETFRFAIICDPAGAKFALCSVDRL